MWARREGEILGQAAKMQKSSKLFFCQDGTMEAYRRLPISIENFHSPTINFIPFMYHATFGIKEQQFSFRNSVTSCVINL